MRNLEAAPSSAAADAEVLRLRRCLNDLLGLFTMPALWTGGEPAHVARVLIETLRRVVHLDVAYLWLNADSGGAPVEMILISDAVSVGADARAFARELATAWGENRVKWPLTARGRVGEDELSLMTLGLGFESELGLLVAAALRPEFPDQTESLLLSVSANQAVLALRNALLLAAQMRLAAELDWRVAERTRELTDANVALRQSEAFLAQGEAVSETGSFLWHVRSGELRCSAQLHHIFEFEPRSRVTFDAIAARVHPEDRSLLGDMIARAQAGRELEYRCRLLMPDGAVKHLHLVARATDEAERGPAYVGAVQNVTERRLSEQALDKLRSELTHAARAMSLGVLTASIAHELNQPLSGIITNASTGLRLLGASPPDVDGALETTRRALRDGKRAADVIARLRALFFKRDFAIERIDLNDAAREVIALSSRELQSHRVVLHIDLDHGLRPVSGDRVQLQQVILNFVLNACEAMQNVDDRGRELFIETAHEEPAAARLTVRDTGVGVPPEALNALFEAFYTTKPTGMGIGLSVSHSIIERHGGRMWATHNAGPGTAFSFSLPYHLGT